MSTVKKGTRVKLKPILGSYAEFGTVRDVWVSEYEGVSPEYTVDTIDSEGRRSTLYLARDKFTLAPKAGAL